MTELYLPGDVSKEEEAWLNGMTKVLDWTESQRNPRKALRSLTQLNHQFDDVELEDDGEVPKLEGLRSVARSLFGSSSPRFVNIDELANRWRAAGLTVVILPGAHTRAARMYASSGYPYGVQLSDMHHTAQGTGWSDKQSIDYLTFYAPYPVMANIYPGKDGRIWILAAGPTYTAGSHPAHGHIPASKGNERGWSWEMPNNGVGEVWAKPLVDILPLAKAIETQYFMETQGWPSNWDKWYMPAHYELTSRKIDPYGPSPWNNWTNTFWNMDSFRATVKNAHKLYYSSTPKPNPEKPIMRPFHKRLTTSPVTMTKDTVKSFPRPEGLPAEAKGLSLAITITKADGQGWLTSRPLGSGDWNDTSSGNFESGNSWKTVFPFVEVGPSGFAIGLGGANSANIIVDVMGWGA